MAFEIPGFSYTLEASADLSAEQFTAMVVDGNGRAAQAGAGLNIAGVLQNNPSALGREAALMANGITKGVAGAAVAAGAYLMTDANGEFITGVATNELAGIALEAAGGQGEIIPILLRGGTVQ